MKDVYKRQDGILKHDRAGIIAFIGDINDRAADIRHALYAARYHQPAVADKQVPVADARAHAPSREPVS